jgi:hypothetical protein
MVKEDDRILLIDDDGIKFKGVIDLIEDNEYYININNIILIFNFVNGYLERNNKLYYCKEYFIENNFIKINFYIEDLRKSNYLSKKLIYELLEFNECECSSCLNIKIIRLCKFLDDYNFINEMEIHIKNFILNKLLVEFITLKINELDRYLENLNYEINNNFKNKILNLKTNYNNTIHTHDTCCICLDEINDTNKLIINCPICNHIFCADDCFERFIQNDDRCPYCRIDLKEWIKIE